MQKHTFNKTSMVNSIDETTDGKFLLFQNSQDEFPSFYMGTQPCFTFPLIRSVRKIPVGIVRPSRNMTLINLLFEGIKKLLWCLSFNMHCHTERYQLSDDLLFQNNSSQC